MGGFTRQRDEFDATILRSLTIDDTSQFNTARDSGIGDEDMMEIDDVSVILDQTSYAEYHTPDPEQKLKEELPEKSQNGLTPLTKLSNFMMSPFHSTPKSSELEKEEAGSDRNSESTLEYRKDNDVDVTPGYSDQTVDTESSLSSTILSPTLLGARLAIGKPRLLLPAPEHGPEEKEAFDFEYNTNSYSASNRESSYDEDKFDTYRSTPELKSRTKLKNTSSYFSNQSSGSFFLDNSDNNDSTEEYIYNPAVRDYDVHNDNLLQNNALNKSYLYKQQMDNLRNRNSIQSKLYQADHNSFSGTPLQIHHHYYYNSSHNGNNDMNDLLSSGVNDNSNAGIGYNTLAELNNQQVVKRVEYTLPLPWESNSSPHEKIPYILSSYLQLIVNICASFYALYLVSSIVKTVKKDIANKLYQHATIMLLEMEDCKRQYNENDCHTDSMSYLLEGKCSYWYQCMNQNPYESGNVSSVSAKTIGIIINSLIEPLELKFFLILFGFIFFLFLCNFTFGFIRAKSYYGWHENDNSTKVSNSPEK